MTNDKKTVKIDKVAPQKRYRSVSEIPFEEREAMRKRCLESKNGKAPKV